MKVGEVKYDADGMFRARGAVYTRDQVERVLALRAEGWSAAAIDKIVFRREPPRHRGWKSWAVLKAIPGAWDPADTKRRRPEALDLDDEMHELERMLASRPYRFKEAVERDHGRHFARLVQAARDFSTRSAARQTAVLDLAHRIALRYIREVQGRDV